ncbi:MAG: N-acetylmuramoyl-L-alanine amidase [Candidatus Omnitrophota bacterium]|nr:N-acetylmuramoyl-L-alanine amidase [Candidatus Omnitrophota bacterium]
MKCMVDAEIRYFGANAQSLMAKHKNILSFFLSAACCLLLAALMTGCATSRLSLEAYSVPALTINGIKYLPLINICQKENISWDYDDAARIVTLTKENTTIKLLLDSPLALIGDKVEDLKDAVKLHNGIIVVPYSFKANILPKLVKFETPAQKGLIAHYKINKICIDAGHGGRDPGAIGRYYGLKEKNIVLDIAMRLKRELKDKGLEIVTTRASDVFIPLEKRAEIANKNGVDLFISVHANASKRKSISGFEVYYISDSADDLARALTLSESRITLPEKKIGLEAKKFFQANLSKNTKTILWDLLLTENRFESVELARHISRLCAQDAGVKVLGVKGAGFAVLRHTQMPAVLVEVGFLSNHEEEKYMKNAFYRQQIAEALACGILSYIKSPDRKI